MIIEFSVGNYRSFNRVQSINFRATGLVSENREVDANNIIELDGTRLLKTVGVYGANGSGKSNLIRGLDIMKRIVSSTLDAEAGKKYVDPFLLGTNQENEAGFFQLTFLLNERRFRYGFTLTIDGDIKKEWLFGPADKNETYYFKRDNKNLQINSERFSEGMDLPIDKLRSDALFLSFCSGYDGEISKGIRKIFSHNITVDRRLMPRFSRLLTDKLIESGQKQVIMNWMKEVGINIFDIDLLKSEEKDFMPGVVFFQKYLYDENGAIAGTYPMDLDRNESDGTRKFYSYIGRIQRKFDQGGLFCSDEIDSNFHPSLLQKLIHLFNNKNINKAGAQLLFTSHDTNLMDPEIMRRDQFYFTEKTLTDETHLYSLADLKGIRNNADFSRQYLAGFYGALPVLGNYLENSENEN